MYVFRDWIEGNVCNLSFDDCNIYNNKSTRLDSGGLVLISESLLSGQLVSNKYTLTVSYDHIIDFNIYGKVKIDKDTYIYIHCKTITITET